MLDIGADYIDGLEKSILGMRKELEALKASIPSLKSDAIRSLLDEDCWDSRIDGELYFRGSSIAEYADELEGIN